MEENIEMDRSAAGPSQINKSVVPLLQSDSDGEQSDQEQNIPMKKKHEVFLYRTEDGHDHDSKEPTERGLSEIVKLKVNELLDLHLKPKAIMAALSKDEGLKLPKMSQLKNYLTDRRRALYENRSSVKQESYIEENIFNKDSMDHNHVESDPVLAFEEPSMDPEERQMAITESLVKVMNKQASAMSQLAHASLTNSQAMERLAEASHIQVKVMNKQATAMSQLAEASLTNSQAMERLAEASHIQARALERLATTFESIGTATHEVRNAIVDIDTSIKRFYTTSPT